MYDATKLYLVNNEIYDKMKLNHFCKQCPIMEKAYCEGVFVLLRLSKINIHGVDGPELALQDDTIFVGSDVIQCQMTSFDLPSWIRHPRFHHFSSLEMKCRNS